MFLSNPKVTGSGHYRSWVSPGDCTPAIPLIIPLALSASMSSFSVPLRSRGIEPGHQGVVVSSMAQLADLPQIVAAKPTTHEYLSFSLLLRPTNESS